MHKIQYLKVVLYSKTKRIICNLTQFEPIMVWKQFLLGLFLLTTIIVIIYTILGDDISSDPLVKLLVVPKPAKDDDYIWNSETQSNILIDLAEFRYTLKPSCELHNVTKILLVTSFAGNVESRSSHRRAYPTSDLSKLGIKRIFLLGLLRNGQSDVTQRALVNENERFSDLMQGNFYEAYRNLTYKHLMGLKWSSHLKWNCDYHKNNVKYIIKMDDDIVVDLYKVVDLIANNERDNVQYDMMGYVLDNVRPIRLKANKWFVTKDEFSSVVYPKFLSGWMYVIKPDLARQLVTLSNNVRYFWIDDVYITGILGHMLQATYLDISKNFTLHPEFFECCIRDNISCHIIAGPNGGDNDLQLRYKKHIEFCITNNCLKISFSKHTCVTQRKMPSIGKGFADIEMVKL